MKFTKQEKYITYFNIPVLALTIVNSFLILNLAPTFVGIPFTWIAFLWFCVLLSNSLLSSNSVFKIILFNLAVAILLFGILEVYCRKKWNDKHRSTQTTNFEVYTKTKITSSNSVAIRPTAEDFVKKDEILGYVPYKDNTVFCSLYEKGKPVLSNVIHTIDSNGLRIAPPYDQNNGKGSILFFGGSYTFGGYVNDHETMPYTVGVKLNGKYRMYNFALNGYGTHHMLAALEHDRVYPIITEKPQYAIYQALVDHVYRLAGLRSWGKHGPKYLLNENKQVTLAGHFDDPQQHSYLSQKIQSYLNKMYFYKLITSRVRILNNNDLDLFLGVIAKSKRILEKFYPDISFHIIFWNEDSDYSHKIIKKLQDGHYNVHLIENILPAYKNDHSKYIKFGHPTPLAYDIISNYVVRNIVKSEYTQLKGGYLF